MDEGGVWMAKAAITELIIRYVALSDAGDWGALAALYTDEGWMNRPTAPDDSIVGRAAILEAFRARSRRAARHNIGYVLATLDGERHARASSQIQRYTGFAGGDRPPIQSTPPPLIGTFDDRRARIDRRWRFTGRRGSLDCRAPK